MAKFTIPEEDREAFISLFSLKPEKKKAFLELIKTLLTFPTQMTSLNILLLRRVRTPRKPTELLMFYSNYTPCMITQEKILKQIYRRSLMLLEILIKKK